MSYVTYIVAFLAISCVTRKRIENFNNTQKLSSKSLCNGFVSHISGGCACKIFN